MISQKKRKELSLVEVAAGVVIRMRLIVGYPQMRTLFVVGVRCLCTQSLTCRCLVSPLWRVPESLCVTDLGRDVCIYVRRVEIESRRLLSWYSGWIANHCSYCTPFFFACSGWSWQLEDRRVLPRVPPSHFVNSNQIIEREHWKEGSRWHRQEIL